MSTRTSDWRHQAACLDRDAELFFPIGQAAFARAQTAIATTICGRCPVREACLDYALDNHIVDGIWGGLDETARASYRRRRDRRRREGRADEPGMDGRVEPTETRFMISVYRDAGKSWREIGERLGASETACRDVHLGARQTVTLATEETARALAAKLVSA